MTHVDSLRSEAICRMTVLRPGLLTSVQDLGRPGLQRHGVSPGGAMDRFAARVANLLVGNDENEPVLEMSLLGAELRFEADAVVAVGGAAAGVLPAWQPVRVKAGEVLALAELRHGCRSYLAVAGGFAVAEIMDSAATDLRARLGGHQGRPLRVGDVLAWRNVAIDYRAWDHWQIGRDLLPRYSSAPRIRVVRGAQADWFTPEAQEALVSGTYQLTQKADRMGLRFMGPKLLLREPQEMSSEGVGFGSIQVPPDGQPIVLMAERQTLGGYPKIADVIAVDLPLLAQLRPGDGVTFEEVSLDEATRLYLANERAIGRLREGLAGLRRPGASAH